MPSIFDKTLEENILVLYHTETNEQYSLIINQLDSKDVLAVDLRISEELFKAFASDFKTDSLPVLFCNKKIVETGHEGITDTEEFNIGYYSALMFKLSAQTKFFFVMKGSVENPYCKFSKQLLKICEELNITDISGFDIFTDDTMRETLKTVNKWPTYPMIYIDGKFIGGLDSFKELNRISQ